jgi:NAD(P)-dependent dehydrogenase (short-subunit alcohol dehydrogenase family)
VTGAAGGIGSAVCAAFAREGAAVVGADLAGADVDADLSQTVGAERAVCAAIERHGRLDVVFNGAGISGRSLGDGPVHECTEEAWDTVLAVNLRSVFLVCKHAVPELVRAGGGSIVNLGSVLGLVGGDEDFATHAYAASKGAIVALSKGIAVAYAKQRIRCNVVAPGLVATPMSRRAQEDARIRARLPELQPLTGDFARPEDVAEAAVYLASPESAFVTGTVVAVDGGWTAK